jgi:hypothetical protein
MKKTTEIQLIIQQQLEQQLFQIYQLDSKIAETKVNPTPDLENLEAQLIEELQQRSQRLTQHIARNAKATKELMRLELEQEQLQRSNLSQQQQMTLLQKSVSTARKHHQFLVSQTTSLQQDSDKMLEQHTALNTARTTMLSTIKDQQKECDVLQEELDALQNKAKHLQQNIAGLQQLREQNLLSVMDLTARLNDVSSGKE